MYKTMYEANAEEANIKDVFDVNKRRQSLVESLERLEEQSDALNELVRSSGYLLDKFKRPKQPLTDGEPTNEERALIKGEENIDLSLVEYFNLVSDRIDVSIGLVADNIRYIDSILGRR